MGYKVIEKKSGEVKLEITVEKEKLEKATKLVLEDLGKNLKISGFRPGKAPLFVVEKEVGKDRFWAEVTDKVVPESFYEAVIAEKVASISAPEIKITQFVPGESLVFEATVAVMPEIKDLKYKNLGIKEKKDKATKEDEAKALEEILKRETELKTVERAAKMGDRVEIDFEGTMKGLPFDGGKSQNHPVVLGSGSLIPGFEEQIVGKKAGDKFDFDITFPKDYHAANLAGQKVNFAVELKVVSEMVTPKATDEIAKKYGFKNLEEFKSEISKQLQIEKDLANKRATEEEIILKIVEKNKIEAPETLVKEEVHRMIHEAEHNLSHSGMTMEQFLEMSKKTLLELEAEMKPEAERRIKIGIVLGEISRLEDLNITDEEIDAEVEKQIEMAGPEVSKEDLRAAYDEPARRREFGNNIIIRKTLDKLWQYNIA